MKTIRAALATVSMLSLFACNRNVQEAVIRSNEGDKARKGNLDEAIGKYQEAASLDPANHKIAWKLTTAYKGQEKWDKVVETVKKAELASELEGSKKKEPSFANYYELHGYALRMLAEQAERLGKKAEWKDVKEPLMAAIKIDPNLSGAYADLAEANQHLDEEKEALSNLTTAIEKNPTNLDFYAPLAALYTELGYFDNAEKVLEEGFTFAKEAKADDPKTIRGLVHLYGKKGFVKEQKGDQASALVAYEAAKKTCGTCNEHGQQIVYFNLGNAYAVAGKKDEATANLKSFNKTVCKGPAKKEYPDECKQMQAIAQKLGATL